MNDTCPAVLFDKFRIIDTLKKDMHTGVYLAYHIYLDKEIILKTLNAESVKDKNVLERFKREARILARLDHPNIIKVLDFGTYEKYFYISFEYFNGINLREAIASGGLKDESKLHILHQLFSGLEAAHSLEVIHRDLKPENILINNDCRIKIADFGLALSAKEDIATNKYGIVGTPGYMSPEQIRGEILTPGSDLFSAGIIILELYTGINPFLGKDINETINNILRFRENSLNEKTAGLPEEVKNIISILLQKNLQSRAQKASDILKLFPMEKNREAVNNFAAYSENLNPAVSSPEKNKGLLHRRYAYIAASFAILLAAVIVILLYIQQKNIYTRNPEGKDSTQKNISSVPSNAPLNKDIAASGIKQDNAAVTLAEIKPENQIPENQVQQNPAAVNNNPEKQSTGMPSDADNKDTPSAPAAGSLMVLCQPWAEIYIDSVKIDTTPLTGTITLKSGVYRLMLRHPDYPPYTQAIRISAHDTALVNINFKNTVGYLECSISPWGDIYIDGVKKGQTPLVRPIALLPGKHSLVVKNPNYSDRQEEIIIKKGETSYYKHVFSR